MAPLTRIFVLTLSAALSLQITIATAALQTGRYKIKGQNRLIGRMCNELRDLFPKKIYSLGDSSEQVVWHVKALDSSPGSNKYSLEIGGAPAIAQGNLAYAAVYLDENVPDTTWLLNAGSGERQYTVSVPYRSLLLTEPREPDHQVLLEPASSESAQIWTFIPVEDDNVPQCFSKGTSPAS